MLSPTAHEKDLSAYQESFRWTQQCTSFQNIPPVLLWDHPLVQQRRLKKSHFLVITLYLWYRRPGGQHILSFPLNTVFTQVWFTFSKPTQLWLDSFESESSHIWLTTHESSTTLHGDIYMYTLNSCFSETELSNTRVRTSWRNRPAQIRKSDICLWSCTLPTYVYR